MHRRASPHPRSATAVYQGRGFTSNPERVRGASLANERVLLGCGTRVSPEPAEFLRLGGGRDVFLTKTAVSARSVIAAGAGGQNSGVACQKTVPTPLSPPRRGSERPQAGTFTRLWRRRRRPGLALPRRGGRPGRRSCGSPTLQWETAVKQAGRLFNEVRLTGRFALPEDWFGIGIFGGM